MEPEFIWATVDQLVGQSSVNSTISGFIPGFTWPHLELSLDKTPSTIIYVRLSNNNFSMEIKYKKTEIKCDKYCENAAV